MSPKEYKGIVCRGSIALGSGCRTCERCIEEQARLTQLGALPEEIKEDISIDEAIAMVHESMLKARESVILAEKKVSTMTKALRLKEVAMKNLHGIIQHKEREASRLHNDKVDLLKANKAMRRYTLKLAAELDEVLSEAEGRTSTQAMADTLEFLNKFGDL